MPKERQMTAVCTNHGSEFLRNYSSTSNANVTQMKAISNSNSDSNENSDENSSGTDALPYKLLSTFHTRNTHQEYFTLMATLNKNHHPAYSSTPVRNDQSITRTTQSPAHLVTIPVDLDLIPTFLGAASNHAKAGKRITTDLAVSTFCDGDMISRPFSRSVNISSTQEINERKGNTRVFV